MDKRILRMKSSYHWGKHQALLAKGKIEEAQKQFEYFEAINKEIDKLK